MEKHNGRERCIWSVSKISISKLGGEGGREER